MARTRRKRKTYTERQRRTILAAAQKQGLTALQVKRKFGVTPVTYYSWRKKSGLTHRRGSGTTRALAGAGLAGHVRSEVQARVRQILPGIVRSEVNAYLDSLFGSSKRQRTRRT